jgi:hypothetical protein
MLGMAAPDRFMPRRDHRAGLDQRYGAGGGRRVDDERSHPRPGRVSRRG